MSGSNCVLSGLTQGTTYYYKVVSENKVCKTTEKTGSAATKSITAPTVTIPSACATSKNVSITYSASNVTSPVYYFKSTVAATSSVGVYACGTSTNPGTCGTSTTTSIRCALPS